MFDRRFDKKIVIDAHALGSRLGGNERYISGLLRGFREIGVDPHLKLLIADQKIQRQYKQCGAWEVIPLRSKSRSTRLIYELPKKLRRIHPDLLHVQYSPPFLYPYPFVTSIHDISFEHFPQHFTRLEATLFKFTIRNAAKRAQHILTLSEFSKQDLVSTYDLKPEKITITPLGVEKKFRPQPKENIERVKSKFEINGSYILTVGNLQPRKNIVRLAEAYLEFRMRLPQCKHKLVIVGKKAWLYDESLAAVASSRFTKDILLTDYVLDEDLPSLYSGAELFVYPSLFEGFGLPPLEAMACGTATITSNTSALPEVVDGAAQLVNPRSISDIADGISLLIKNKSYREGLSEKGIDRAKKFTWQATAEKTWGVYERFLKL